MSHVFAALCVGGPLDGQRLAAKEPVRIVPIADATVSATFEPAKVIPDKAVTLDMVQYNFAPLYFDQGRELELWTPAGQTRFETLEKLIKGYKP